METLTVAQQNLLKNAAEQNGIKDFEIELSAGSQKGDNFLGVITIANIKDKNSDKVVSTILKTTNNVNVFATEDDPGPSKVFVREEMLYQKVLPLLKKFQEDENISNPFRGFPHYYGSTLEDNHESILLDNLKSKKYQLWNKKIPMNHNHVALVFTEYAKLHATSMALKVKQPEVFKDWESKLYDHFLKAFENNAEVKLQMYRMMNENVANLLKDYPKLLEAIQKNNEQRIKAMDDVNNETVTVIHGDSWCNNMLFKYDEDNDISRPSKVCLIDFQLSRIGSPIWDLTYFFTVNASKEVLHNYLKYLEIYHKTLSQNLEEFGLDPDEVYSFDRLKTDWKKYAKCGFVLMIILGKIMIAEPEEIPDMKEFEKHKTTKSLDMLIEFDEEKQNHYIQRIVDVLEYFLDEGLFHE